jgi:hypothetical protein
MNSFIAFAMRRALVPSISASVPLRENSMTRARRSSAFSASSSLLLEEELSASVELSVQHPNRIP